MKKRIGLLSVAVLAIAGLLMAGCTNGDDDNSSGNGPGGQVTPGTIAGITLIVMNGSAQTATGGQIKQLPPGARVVVDAEVTVTGGTANEEFTVDVDIPAALTGKVTVTDFDPDGYPGAKQIQVVTDAPLNEEDYEWITVTVASVGKTTEKAEWKFIVWGDSVTPGANFNVNDPKLRILPNRKKPPREDLVDTYRNAAFVKFEDATDDDPTSDVTVPSVPMSNRYRLVGELIAEYREDEDGDENDNAASLYNGAGYITGEYLEMVKAAPAGSMVRLYFNRQNLGYGTTAPNSGVFGYMNADRNGWGVLKFGDDNLSYNAKSGQTFYIDASVDKALAAMAANHEDDLYVNVFNARLLFMELWELKKPITHSNAGTLIEQTAGATVNIMKTGGGYEDEWALIATAGDGSFLRITIDTPETRPGWGVIQIGGTTTGRFETVNVTEPVIVLTEEQAPQDGWVRFTADLDLYTMFRTAQFTIPLEGATTAAQGTTIRFNVWYMSTASTESDRFGTPRIVKVELWTIDD